MDSQVGGQRSDARSVARRSSGCAREVSLGRATTPGPPTLDDVLGDDEADLGQLEDLAVFGIDHFGVVEVRTTRGAGGSWLITWSDSAICQVFARCNGLLSVLAAAARRSAREGAGGFATPSADGGIDELRGLRPRHSSKSASFDWSIDT
jgi:hypothetical protein